MHNLNHIHTAHYASPVGGLLLAEQGGKLIGLWIEGQKYFMGALNETVLTAETPVLSETKVWLDRYFAGEKPALPERMLAPEGTPFQRAVWACLLRIPYGETTTYGAIARELAGRSGVTHMSAQAVGGAVGRNPISILIPCHRVVGSNGSLTGYAAGIEKKKLLLSLEGVDTACFRIPTKGTAL